MRRPNKASQLDKRRNRAGLHELNRSIIAWNGKTPDGTVIILDKKTRNRKQATESLFWSIDRMNHHWKMCIVAIGIEPSGRMNFHLHDADVRSTDNPGPHNHKNLVDAFNRAQKECMDRINPNFEKAAMWMASLEEIDYSDADLERIWAMQ